uniref:Golgi to ER traffic protein 4 n=1 Tax=Aceria tosichella TaxID=561515 RepID=A0A6G1SMM4_9ACAR
MEDFEYFQPGWELLGKEDKTTLASYLDSPKFVQASTNATRLVNKLKAAVGNQELYETQQILRTVYFRFINHAEKVDPLADLLYYGVVYLLERGEHISGQDIASLFLDTSAKRLQTRLDGSTDPNLNEQPTVQMCVKDYLNYEPLALDICRKLSSIVVLLPDTEIGQTKFVAEAFKTLPPKLLNRDLLHEVLATRFYQIRDYPNARYHFLHSACVDRQYVVFLLVEFHALKGTPSEVDLFIAQFVLQFLCLQLPTDSPVPSTGPGQSRHQRTPVTPSNLAVSKKSRKQIKETIRYIFLEYINRSYHPDLANIAKPYDLPLLNFILLLTSILDSDKSEANAFKFLVDTYEKAWSRDPNYQSYLNRIGVLYFGLTDPAKQQQQQASGGGGFFNNILMSLLDGPDDDDEEEAAAEQTLNALSSYDELD